MTEEPNPLSRFICWLSHRTWDAAHAFGRVEVGDDYWLSNILYVIALSIRAVLEGWEVGDG